MNVLSYVYNIISGRTSKQRSIDNVMACMIVRMTSGIPIVP